ncbi:tRNA (adenosine(37)-N6)-threonylcarbamoyltransferase complex dimerization subunit type 1 TsaB [Alteromonas sp. RKMC-009]|uniref:tRNA (adenosine(37)-N6)-threonylcarbamoyltransferase complex dimerization subunit type 1 TsaB n=1 Tax=Alteromonas sp. RKMC-009 TaxID=2267264 RepID=UPI000E6934D2|nr:tRNA (adenosine(37)-N6)-threonylcarbamoyltransferase complex dimerization subunit type 1 TsaB [Alteromonas sp. RKMC-009]AYA65002.1 tRNA (adenosine(37)-N6)-threonylcarbamoyltransferase complex dimerization subunit type 1 TsaB [Alteromonas sp. RKMC-009]
MILLAIDTATEACSVAVKTENGIFHRFEICPQQHSQRLLPMVDEVMKEAGVSLKDTGGLVYGRGPGSFTGVRIATGMIQGLALGTGLEVAGVSTLTAMAQQVIDTQGAGRIACAIDARMGEVYFAQFTNVNGQAELTGEEQVCPPEHAATQLSGDFARAGTGWMAYDELKQFGDEPPQVLYPDALHMLKPGEGMFAGGMATSVDNIEPVYLRDKVTWKKLPGRE